MFKGYFFPPVTFSLSSTNHRFLRIVSDEVIFGRSIGWGAPLEDWDERDFFGGLWLFWFKKSIFARLQTLWHIFENARNFCCPTWTWINDQWSERIGKTTRAKGWVEEGFFLFSQGSLPICSGEAWCISFCCWVIWSDLKKRHSLDWCQDISAPEQSGSTCDIGGSTPIFLECRRGWSST